MKLFKLVGQCLGRGDMTSKANKCSSLVNSMVFANVTGYYRAWFVSPPMGVVPLMGFFSTDKVPY